MVFNLINVWGKVLGNDYKKGNIMLRFGGIASKISTKIYAYTFIVIVTITIVPPLYGFGKILFGKLGTRVWLTLTTNKVNYYASLM